MRYIFLLVMLVGVALSVGCENTQPLSMLLQESTESDEIVSQGAACYKTANVDNESSEYAFIFDKACLDAVFTGGSIDMPNLPAGVTPVEMSSIVDDAASGSDSFSLQWVYVDGTVTKDLTDGGRSLSLSTGNESVRFRVSSFVKKSQLAQWTKNNTYGFILLITNIQNNEGITTIFSRVDDPVNIANGRSVLTPPPHPGVLAASIDVLLESFRAGESYYIGKRVGFLDTVKLRQDDQTSQVLGTTYDRLVVYVEDTTIFATGRDTFSIYQTMNLFEGEIDEKYTRGTLQNFEVTIHYLSGEDFFNPNKVSITGYFEDKTFLPN